MKRLSRHVILSCTNRRAGCPEVIGLNLLLQNKKSRPFACYICPFSNFSNVFCEVIGIMQDFKVRVLRNHKENSLEIYGRRGGGEFIGTYLH
jgi:hypothetical protein